MKRLKEQESIRLIRRITSQETNQIVDSAQLDIMGIFERVILGNDQVFGELDTMMLVTAMATRITMDDVIAYDNDESDDDSAMQPVFARIIDELLGGTTDLQETQKKLESVGREKDLTMQERIIQQTLLIYTMNKPGIGMQELLDIFSDEFGDVPDQYHATPEDLAGFYEKFLKK